MYLLDTNICIALLKGNQAAVTKLARQSPDDLAVCTVVQAELYYGARKSEQVSANLKRLEAFFAPLRSLSFDDLCAQAYGSIRAELERAGTPIGPNDLLIAATARAYDLTLVTNNTREFARIVGLRLEDWSS